MGGLVPPPTDVSSAPRSLLLRRWVVVIGVVAIVANAGAAAYDGWRAYRNSIADVDRELGNTARLVAAQTAGPTQAVDVLLRDTVNWYENHSSDAISGIEAELAPRAEGLPWLLQLSIYDVRGIQQYRAKASAPVETDVADRSYFSAHRDDPTLGLFVSEPFAAGSARDGAIALSRRLHDRDGRFAGVVSSFIPLDYLQDLYQQIDLGTHSTILLLREDGTLLVREPSIATAVGQSLPTPAAVGGTSGGAVLLASPIDGLRRFVAGAPVDGLPLIADVSRDEASVLAPPRADAIRVLVRTLVLSLLGAVAIAALARQLRRVEFGERALRESEQRYALAMDTAAEKERLEGRLRTAQTMQAVGTLARRVAHDCNNILSAILGYGELAQKAAPDGTDLRRYVDNVMRAGTRAKTLVEQIVAFSRGGLGERTPVKIQAIVGETLDSLAASLPSTVRLERRLEAGDVAVLGDAANLRLAVMSLCTNAVQTMPEGGVLDVSLEGADVSEPKNLSHGDLTQGSYVRLTVRDTRSAIEPELLDHIFDPYFTTKRAGEGTGFELSAALGIVTDVGGAIDVASTREGTTFSVWLPALAAPPTPAQKTHDEPPPGNGQVVMIVDDEPALVALAEETLAELGYEPVGFVSSQKALEAFSAEPQRFDLVLTDAMMPDLTGTELALQTRRLRADIPIVIMTGYTDSGVAALARSAGVNEILRKPLQRQDIAESLARMLNASSRASR